MERMVRAGFKPEGMTSLLTKLSQESDNSRIDQWMSDHPEGKKRAAAAAAQESEIRALQAQNAASVKPVFPAWNFDSLREETPPVAP